MRRDGFTIRCRYASYRMATVTRARVPASEFVLHRTLQSLPGPEFDRERIVETGADVVMPLVWARWGEPGDLDAALADDPTVDGYSLIGDFDGEFLYRMR